MSPRVSFQTIGCRLNQAETAAMTAGFLAAGYAITPSDAACDVAVVHGCAITRKAERDSARAARAVRLTSPDAVIIVAGCPAEMLGDALRGECPADLIVGQTGKFALPALLHGLHPDRFPAPPSAADAPLPAFDTKRAFVKVQDGCDFRCAYCVVPAARGAPRSRPLHEVAAELSRLAEQGFREVVLTGANLGCYADGEHRLLDVIRAAEAVPGLERIRLSSIETTTAERAVIDHMASSAKLCRFLHLPLQSGDDGILRAMGRRYTKSEYAEVVAYAAARIPDVGIGTDIITGFPGEDEAAFEATLRLLKSLPLSNLHVFPYSRRAGTRAAELSGQVPVPVRKERVRRLLAVGATQRAAFARRFLGRRVDVLVERVDADGTAHGWTGEYLPAEIRGAGGPVNRVVTLAVDAVDGDRLVGRVTGD